MGEPKSSSEDRIYDVVILGGGPAGLTAGIYARRARLDTILVEKLLPGGLAATTDRIENYPGFPDGIGGGELMGRMEEQTKSLGLAITSGEVKSVDFEGSPKRVETDEASYSARVVIVATGTEPRKIGVPGEDEFRGKGVSYCATCDGPLFREKALVVVGCGDSGIKEGLFLLKFAQSITFVELLPHMTAEKIIQERVLSEPRMKFYFGHSVTFINGADSIESVTIRSKENGAEKVIEAQGVFIYVGLNPNTHFLRGKVKLDEGGYVLTNENLETSVPGVFACGDVRQKTLRQIATAIGDGALAAFMADRYLAAV